MEFSPAWWPVMGNSRWRPGVVLLGIVGFGWNFYQQSQGEQFVAGAVPEIDRLLQDDRLFAAFQLYQLALEYQPDSPELLALSERVQHQAMNIETEPPGATIYIEDYLTAEASEDPFGDATGTAPLELEIPKSGNYQVHAELDGYEPLTVNVQGVAGQVDMRLVPLNSGHDKMTWVSGVRPEERNPMNPAPPLLLEGFWLDKYEVTNHDFADFVAAGGYQEPEYWVEPFQKDGRAISFYQAIAEFQDATGFPGPSTWQLGSPVDGTEDFPVGGVSWYEAAAYCTFRGKQLPTVYHWFRGAQTDFGSAIVLTSNFESTGPEPVTADRGVARYGNYDMAGNVEEWTSNPVGNRRYLLGGSWNAARYVFGGGDAEDPFARSADFGFRCASYDQLPEEFLGPVSFKSRDRRGEPHLSDEQFQLVEKLYAFEDTPLDASDPVVDDSSPYWTHETVSFQAGYPNERVTAHLLLPKNVDPPYQVIALGMGSDSLTQRSYENLIGLPLFLVRSGRAILLPAYEGTLERGPALPEDSNGERERLLKWPKDLIRCIDYLETRPETFDTSKVGYWGLSYGVEFGPNLLALEPRVKAAVFVVGGTNAALPEEIDPWNFTPRLTIPVLMINAEEDFVFPKESTQIPFYEALGTPDSQKDFQSLSGGHADVLSRSEPIRWALDWFDEYLGPVEEKQEEKQ